MKRPDKESGWLIGGMLIFLVGVAWTFSSLQRYPAEHRRIERKRSDLQEIINVQRAQEQELAAVRLFDQLPAPRPPDLAALIREQLPDSPAEVRQRETHPAWDAWQAHRMEVRFESIPVHEIGRLLTLAEQQRPPWRLVEGNIRAAEDRPESARATLIFEGLMK